MNSTISNDGTRIVYDVYGDGPVVIIVNGTMGSRGFGPSPVAQLLASNFTVYDYDRRGRGDSGDNQPYAPQKEIEDLQALIQTAGGSAYVCGLSAGAALAMEAAIELGEGRITKLAMYEAPFTNDPLIKKQWKKYGAALQKCSKAGDKDGAVMLFMELVKASDSAVEGYRKDHDLWEKLKALSPTLLYDYLIIGESREIPTAHASRVSVPTLVVNGSASEPSASTDAEALAAVIPHVTHRILKDQTHDVDPNAIVPVLINFFKRS
jgi:pimeloyl-ACP methyl ester carboxylesterase